jgi:hypothetical protein
MRSINPALAPQGSPTSFPTINPGIWARAQTSIGKVLYSNAASIAVDLVEDNNFYHDLTESTTLAAPTNARPYQTGVFFFKQHASSAKALAANAFWKMNNGATWPGVSTTLSAITRYAYQIMPDGLSAVVDKLGETS